jgi:hypothetical protein
MFVASKVRSKPPIERTEALHSADLGTTAQTSPVAAYCTISTPLMLARMVLVAERSAIKYRRISVATLRPQPIGM